MKRRRILAGASALLIGTALLAGCDGGGGSKGTGTYGGVDIAKLEKTDIQLVAHYDVGLDNEKSAIGKTVKWWKENVGGNVSLNVVSADIYPTKIMGMISANNSPDLVAVSSGNWMPRFPVANIIEPVDPYIKKDDLLDYEKMPFEDLSWKGQHYALYTMGSWAQCIWYNKTMFTNNGVKTPREYWEEGNWTWDTFLEVAKELTQDTNNDKATDQWGYANWTPDVFAMANNASMARTNANGTVEIIWDQGPYKNSIQFAQDLMNKHKVTPLDYSYHVNAFKGGTLATLPPDAEAPLKALRPEASAASWALRWVGSHQNVHVILSGMSAEDQLEDNLKTFEHFEPLSPEETQAVEKTAAILHSRIKIGCTGCRYCMPCPMGVDIPDNFSIWNKLSMFGQKDAIKKQWAAHFPDAEKASHCARCGKCEGVCPQKLPIRASLAQLQQELDAL